MRYSKVECTTALHNYGPIRWAALLLTALAILATLSACGFVSAAPPNQSSSSPLTQDSGTRIQAMQIVTSTLGWALTNNRLVWTNDSGLQWTDITPRATSASKIRAVSFLDSQYGWAVADAPPVVPGAPPLAVFRTTDGGMTWLSAPLAPPGVSYPQPMSGLIYLSFADTKHGWVMAKLASSSNFSRGELFYTADGGATWSKRSIPIGGSIRFISPTDGWIAGGPAGDKLYVTRDAGLTWQALQIPSPSIFTPSAPVYDLPVFVSAQDGVLPVTFAGTPSGVAFYVTRDAGRSWTLETSKISQRLVEVGVRIPSKVIDANTWLAAVPQDRPVLLQTRDKGRNWQEVQPNGLPIGPNSLPVGPRHIDFVTLDRGWAIVQYGFCTGFKKDCTTISDLFRTTNAGQTWTRLNP